jgi:hypothetical protein
MWFNTCNDVATQQKFGKLFILDGLPVYELRSQ